MSNSVYFQLEILSGRISYEDLSKASKEDFTAPFKGSEGVNHHDRIFIKYVEIYWGQTEENPVRVKGSSSKNIRDLATSRRQGIDPTAPRPAVELNNIVDPITGKTYKYKAENGITRKKADAYNGVFENGGDWYDVVSYEDTENHTAAYNREVFLQLQNDDLPQEVHSSEDIRESCFRLISSGDLKKEEDAITDFVYEAAPNLRTEEKNDIIRQVIKDNDVPTRTISWRDNECTDWWNNKCVETEPEVDYFFPDHYFQDRIYPVLKQFWKEDKVQIIAEHVSNKGGDNPELVDARRSNADKKWEQAEQVFKAVAIYMIANDWKLPVERGRFMPQIKSGDNKEDMNRFVHR